MIIFNILHTIFSCKMTYIMNLQMVSHYSGRIGVFFFNSQIALPTKLVNLTGYINLASFKINVDVKFSVCQSK